jgi:hypothetical protein
VAGDDFAAIEPGRACDVVEVVAVVHHRDLDQPSIFLLLGCPGCDVWHPRRHQRRRGAIGAAHQHRLRGRHDIHDARQRLRPHGGGPRCGRPGRDLEEASQWSDIADRRRTHHVRHVQSVNGSMLTPATSSPARTA